MEAIVLAGGLGTRLRAVVPDLPKSMAPIGERPFLEIILGVLAQKGFTRIILSLGYKADTIVSHFGRSFAGMRLLHEIEEQPLGTGGALRRALARCEFDHAFVFNGDTFLDLEVAQAEAHWQANRFPIIVGRNVADTTRYGRLEARDRRITRFVGKDIPGPGLINAGCYIFPPDILDRHEPGRAFSLESDFLESAVMTQHFDLFVSEGFFMDIGIPEDYLRAQTTFTEILS